MNIKDIQVEGDPPSEGMIRLWLKANEGRVDGDTVVIRMANLQAMLGQVTKTIVKSIAGAMAITEEETKPRSPNDPNYEALNELGRIADTLVTMRDGFKGGDEGWKPLIAAVEASLASVSRALILACGRDA